MILISPCMHSSFILENLYVYFGYPDICNSCVAMLKAGPCRGQMARWARNKFSAPMCEPQTFCEWIYSVEEGTCNIVGIFRPNVFWGPAHVASHAPLSLPPWLKVLVLLVKVCWEWSCVQIVWIQWKIFDAKELRQWWLLNGHHSPVTTGWHKPYREAPLVKTW